jgi:hypothetical protein
MISHRSPFRRKKPKPAKPRLRTQGATRMVENRSHLVNWPTIKVWFRSLVKPPRVVLRHETRMTTHGPALSTWPLIFGPLHDALTED